LFCGFGLGYHLEAFLKLYPEKRVYLYEPYVDTLLCALEQRDLRPILKNEKIAMFGVGCELKTQVDFIESAFVTSSQTIRLMEVPVYRLAYPELVNNYRQLIAQLAASAASSLRTLTYFRKDWIRNLILNMGFNLYTPSIKGMKGKCNKIPAIVVGSGPSLEMEKESLRLFKNHALIIAAGTSTMALQKYGIEPDLVVSMDPGWHNFKAFRKVDITDIPFLYIPTVYSGILSVKNKYMMHAFFNLDAPTTYFMGLTNEDPVFASTATVSGTAIQTAIYLGCNEIIFIGQDYSFPGDQFYAEGVTHDTQETLASKLKESKEKVLNVNGGMNRSNLAMNVARQGIEQLIYMYPECNFYNASKVGAEIDRTQPRSLDKLYEKFSQVQLENDWFKKLVKKYARKYHDNRKNEIRNRVINFHRKSFEFEIGINKLVEHITSAKDLLEQENNVSFQNWLLYFEGIWKPIIDDESFKYVYGFFFQRELNYLVRSWSEMLDVKEERQKIIMLIEMLTPFLESWEELSPLIRLRLDDLVQREIMMPGSML